MQRTIVKVRLFCEPPSEPLFEAAPFESTGPSMEFFRLADDALGYVGKLIKWLSKEGIPVKEYIERIDDIAIRSFFAKCVNSNKWDLYFASNEMGIRYSLLVEYSD